MERRIDYQKKLCDVCNDAMESIVEMMKKRGIKVLRLDDFIHFDIAYAHYYVEEEIVEEAITAVCVNDKNDMLYYTTEQNIEMEIENIYDEDDETMEDIYDENGEYDYEKLYDYDKVWCSFYDGELTDVIDVYGVVYEILKLMEE